MSTYQMSEEITILSRVEPILCREAGDELDVGGELVGIGSDDDVDEDGKKVVSIARLP